MAIVKTSYGRLRGSDLDGVQRFRGIPFARPPVGDLRWRPPQPPEGWSGEREALDYGPSALQRPLPGGMGALIGIPSETMSEDCLYLNVWTPSADDRRRPVMFWIHGGGNTVGSGSQPRIDGEHLARRGDVVVVTTNYRLGSFGFLHAPSLGASGNEALLDQVAALRWVRQEIAGFGGDPENVTVFGQSAGGFDIAQLMGLPAAAGCFQRAVPMSGSLTQQIPADVARSTAKRFAEKLGGLEKLREVPAEALLDRQVELTGGRFGPVKDGEVIREDAAVGIGEGRHTRGMPLMIGNTLHESALFARGEDDLDAAGLAERAKRLFADDAVRAVDVYRSAHEKRGDSAEPRDLWIAMLTDQMFRMPAVRTAGLHVSHTPRTWMYLFDYRSPAMEGKLGACHSLDIPFIWGTTGVENMREFCGAGPEVERLSAIMMDTYLAFAKRGDPGHSALPDWPAFDLERRATMRLGAVCRVEDAPGDDERQLWADRR